MIEALAERLLRPRRPLEAECLRIIEERRAASVIRGRAIDEVSRDLAAVRESVRKRATGVVPRELGALEARARVLADEARNCGEDDDLTLASDPEGVARAELCAREWLDVLHDPRADWPIDWLVTSWFPGGAPITDLLAAPTRMAGEALGDSAHVEQQRAFRLGRRAHALALRNEAVRGSSLARELRSVEMCRALWQSARARGLLAESPDPTAPVIAFLESGYLFAGFGEGAILLHTKPLSRLSR